MIEEKESKKKRYGVIFNVDISQIQDLYSFKVESKIQLVITIFDSVDLANNRNSLVCS